MHGEFRKYNKLPSAMHCAKTGGRIEQPASLGAIALIVGTLAGPALASEAGAPPTAAPAAAMQSEQGGLQEIIVTAQKRSENLQNVPMSVLAITAKDALSKGITGTDALTAVVPGLVMPNPVNVGNPYLRGVGSSLFDPSSEQSVAMYIDGVYISAPQSNIFSFNNIQQVEVLRGPQGTLFGRNATGGVIQITTRQPSATPHFDGSVGYGSYRTLTASAYVTGGLAPGVAADLSGLYENQGHGYGRNLTTGSKTFQQARGNFSLRSKIVINPSDATKFTLSADYSHSVSTNAYQKPPGVFSPIDGSTYPGKYNAVGDLDDLNRVDTGGGSVKYEQKIGRLRLTNLLSYRKTRVHYDLDNDITAIPAVNVILEPRTHNWAEELQLSGPNDGWLKWIIGGYYYNSFGGYDSVVIDGTKLIVDAQKARSYAGFGQFTAKILPDTEITGGLRYTKEKQDYILTFPVALGLHQSFSKLTYRVALAHHFSKTISAYGSVNTGFKSGGYNLLAPGNNFKPETLTAYEVGLKTELFDRRLRFNIDAFYYKDKNVQVLSSIPGGTITSNAAAARMKGIEAEFDAAPDEHLRISGGISIQNGKYTSFPGGVALDPQGRHLPVIDQRGNQTIITPPLSGNLSASYTFFTPSGTFQPTIAVSHSDRFFWQSDNRLTQPSYTLLNASILWTSGDKRFDARLWGKNLGDARYYIARLGVEGLGDVQEQAAPRTVGLTLGLHL